MERDAQFVYLALERCAAALHDVMEPLPGGAPPVVGGKTLQFVLPSDPADGASAGQNATEAGPIKVAHAFGLRPSKS